MQIAANLFTANRTKKVAMLVSNCKPYTKFRLDYARELGKHIQVLGLLRFCVEKERWPGDGSGGASFWGKPGHSRGTMVS